MYGLRLPPACALKSPARALLALSIAGIPATAFAQDAAQVPPPVRTAEQYSTTVAAG